MRQQVEVGKYADVTRTTRYSKMVGRVVRHPGREGSGKIERVMIEGRDMLLACRWAGDPEGICRIYLQRELSNG